MATLANKSPIHSSPPKNTQTKKKSLSGFLRSLCVTLFHSLVENELYTFEQCCRSLTFWDESADLCLWPTDPDPDLAIYVFDLQGASKKLFFSKLFCLLVFKGTFASFFQDKK
jgi:hypothetical protein